MRRVQSAVDAVPSIDALRWGGLDTISFDAPSAVLPAEVRRTSEGLPWLGLRVWHQLGAPGDRYNPPRPEHMILVRRSTPTDFMQRQGAQFSSGCWRPGECILIPAGVPSFSRSSGPRDILHVDLDPAWMRRAVDADVQLRSCFAQEDPVLSSLAQVLLASLDTNTSLQPSFAENMALAIALHLAENYADPRHARRPHCGLSARQMRTLHDAVVVGLDQRWTVARLAGLVELSPFHFSRSFKLAFGTSPHAYVCLLRMQAAARMMREARRSIAEIALATGHASPAHFTQAFRRHWGVTPSEFRGRC